MVQYFYTSFASSDYYDSVKNRRRRIQIYTCETKWIVSLCQELAFVGILVGFDSF